MKNILKTGLLIILCAVMATGCSSKSKPKKEEPVEENFYPLYLD